jgi:hypothetical protein
MMIVGVSSKVAPVLAGADLTRLNSLRLTFWLINIGSAMRVGFQILTDMYGWAFPMTALSAWVEITGLTIWAVDLWRTMSSEWALREPGLTDGIRSESKVYDVITRYPQTEEIFLQFGFSMITNPAARRVFARSISLAQACRLKAVPLDQFLGALRAKSCSSAPALVTIGGSVAAGRGHARRRTWPTVRGTVFGKTQSG